MTSEAILGRNLYAIDTMERTVEQVIRQLPLRGPDGAYLIGDEALRVTTMTAQAGSKAFWRLACAARAEIVRRISERTSDSTVIAREIAREAHEQHVSPRILRRDAAIGTAYAPLFAEPDTAPDLDRTYYSVALRAPDPQAALALAAERKDSNPFYNVQDFEAEIARARMADPAAGYGSSSAGRCGLVFLWPFWSEGVLEATERALDLPLRRWLLPDAFVLIRTPPRALDLSMRLLTAHEGRYSTTIALPVPPYNDGGVWHEQELLLMGTLGKLRLPTGLPGTWRDSVERSITLYFPFISRKLDVYPRYGPKLGEDWVIPEELPPNVR